MPSESTAPERTESFFGGVSRNLELVIAVLLGVVSIVTAYASFQAALYDGNTSAAYQVGSNQSTEAESLYLEANQQFVQDTQVYNRLTELKIDAASSDAATAEDAQLKYDTLSFQAVGDDFAKAIEVADEQNAADPDFYYSPLDDEDYQAALFGSYAETKDKATATIAKGDEYNALGDRLTLNTVLMSISLFLLGIAAVVRIFRVQVILMSTGIVIFLVAAILTATIPYVGLG